MAEVVIYTRQLCGFCTRAKKLFDKKGVKYTEFDATTSPKLKEEMIKKSNGGRTFPQVFIDSKHIGGCDDLFDLEWDGKLDKLLVA